MTTTNLRSAAMTAPSSPREQLIEVLGLGPYQDRGISLEQVRSFTLRSQSTYGTDLADIPWLIIERLMRMDHRGVQPNVFDSIAKTHRSVIPKNLFPLHPTDTLFVVLQCCDMILKQVLYRKLALCRIALPFIFQHEDKSLELLLWPLRSIALQWSTAQNTAVDVSLVKHPFKIASFIRLGKICTSKSIVVNHILDAPKSGVFFHAEALGGKRHRHVGNGFIEMSYSLTAGQIKEDALVLNLRGDGKEYQQQCDLLCQISSLVVIFVDIEECGKEETLRLIHTLKEKCNKVILLLTSENEAEECCPPGISQDDFAVVYGFEEFGGMKNAIGIADDVTVSLRKELGQVASPMKSLEVAKETYISSGIRIDEDAYKQFSGMQDRVKKVIDYISSDDIASAKKGLLPLQGPVLREWSDKLKEKNRGLKGLKEMEAHSRNESLSKQMATCREQQFASANNLQPLMKEFIEFQKDDKSVFFRRLKLELDDISRSKLPQLRETYKSAWTNRENDPKAFETASTNLEESSLGVEHLFREMGQLYESMEHFEDQLTPEQSSLLKTLPELAAEHFLAGHSFEVMNGDSGSVPLKWITAVFDSLAKKIGTKTMFALSVVGVQSSGKSTLLNTMFGLELAVGAGRCTRGVFAQLIPVDKEHSKLAVDYILVIDSEGLCSTSVQGSTEHDNEIATFVVGLADLTIVNIMGENPQQMKEIFGIAVHAFMRMKRVEKFKKQKCIFLHQCVSQLAKDDLTVQSHELETELDELTKEAAEATNMAGTIFKFSHVLDFDCEKNIFHIPNLWNGTPPMAQVEIGYSEEVQKLREYFLFEVESVEGCDTTENMKIRLKDMWNGVLSDDFLFNFKNNLSVKAFLLLERKFFELAQHAESLLIQHINKESKLEISKCGDRRTLLDCKVQVVHSFTELGNKLKDKLSDELDDFFNNHELKKYLDPWKESKKISLTIEIGKMVQQRESELEYYVACKCIEVDKLDESTIVRLAQTLAENNKGKVINEDILKREYDTVWEDWERKLQLNQDLAIYDVDSEVNQVLNEVFHRRGHAKFLKPSDKKASGEDLTAEDMRKDYLANKAFPEDMKNRLGTSTELVPKQPSRDTYFENVVRETNIALQRIKQNLSEMARDNVKFYPKLAKDIIECILEDVEKHNALSYKESVFTLTTEFEAMIATRVANMAKEVFIPLEEKFEKTSTIRAKIAELKTQLYNLFLNTVHERLIEAAADFLCDKAKGQIIDTVNNDVPRQAVDILMGSTKYTKEELLTAVLRHLAERKSFDSYMKFVKNVYQFTSEWMEMEGKKILFDVSNGNQYCTMANTQLDTIMSNLRNGIQEAVSEACSNPTMPKEEFIASLVKNIGDIVPFTQTQFKLLQSQTITDYKKFEELVTVRLDVIDRDIRSNHSKVKADTVSWTTKESPYQQAMDRLWGCKESCPMCRSPCFYTTVDHVKGDNKNHECWQHWPKGIGGTRWRESQKLSTDVCSFAITTGSSFNCAACQFKCRESGKCTACDKDDVFHPHRDYKEYLPTWDIAPQEVGEASKYWQWVMGKYPKELANYHKAKVPDIPSSWSKKEKEAVESLNQLPDAKQHQQNGSVSLHLEA